MQSLQFVSKHTNSLDDMINFTNRLLNKVRNREALKDKNIKELSAVIQKLEDVFEPLKIQGTLIDMKLLGQLKSLRKENEAIRKVFEQSDDSGLIYSGTNFFLNSSDVEEVEMQPGSGGRKVEFNFSTPPRETAKTNTNTAALGTPRSGKVRASQFTVVDDKQINSNKKTVFNLEDDELGSEDGDSNVIKKLEELKTFITELKQGTAENESLRSLVSYFKNDRAVLEGRIRNYEKSAGGLRFWTMLAIGVVAGAAIGYCYAVKKTDN